MSFFPLPDIEFGTFHNQLRKFLYTFPTFFVGIILLSVPNFPLSAYYHNFSMNFQCIQANTAIFSKHFINLMYSRIYTIHIFYKIKPTFVRNRTTVYLTPYFEWDMLFIIYGFNTCIHLSDASLFQ